MADRTPSTPRLGPFTLCTFTSTLNPAPLPAAGTHPVEVVGRIREHPDGRGEPSVIYALPGGRDLRITSKEHQQGYRVFSLDGVSKAEDENLEAFYLKYAEARIDDVKTGGKCTIMMYGPTGAGKSHTMFGSASEQGVAYHALAQIMGDRAMDEIGNGQEVKATVWEIFNEEIFDLLAQTSNPAGSLKGQTNRVKLEVKGKRVRNSVCIRDSDPNRLLREIQKVEKRRVTKSTNCNDRSSRSHCVVTFEVPAVDGRLLLVDMAGSENIDQAGIGMESKIQTGKINQGNVALRRVVEAIANGESHIPYRDSKLTMLLQESFEDKNAKVLMVLCASPDPKDLYKTLGTFEYGAKAKRIVRLPNSPAREKATEEEQQKLAIVSAKDIAKDACIMKLRREKERSDREKEVKEREVTNLRKRVYDIESEMTFKRNETDLQLHEFRRQVDLENEQTRRRLEELEQLLEQKQKEAEFQRLRADKAEAELNQLKRVSFSNLENDPESADWGSMKRHNSPKEKKEKKFSSSVMSFFKGSDSAHSSKKSPHVKMEYKSRESLQHTSPKHDKKRLAGQEAPSPKTAEKKRHMGQDIAITAMTWQPTTLQELLKVKEEDVSQDVREGAKTPSSVDTHKSWYKSLSSKFTESNVPSCNGDLALPDSNHVNPEGETMDSSPPEQLPLSTVDEELTRHVEMDPLGLLTWSEPKLHRKGWLPIIMEEQEDDGDGVNKLGRRSLEDPGNRGFASCPRFSDGGQALKLGHHTAQSLSSPAPDELNSQNIFPSNLLRDKFSPLTAKEGGKKPEIEGEEPSSGGYMDSNVLIAVKEERDLTPVRESRDELGNSELLPVTPVDSFLQRLVSRSSEADEAGGTSEPTVQSQTQGECVPVEEAATARKARIENIFLLCGNRREIAARTGAELPSHKVSATSSVRENGEHVVHHRGHSLGESFAFDDSISTSVPSSPLPSFRERDNQSHLSLEVDGYYSPAKSPFRVLTNFENRLRSSSASPEVIGHLPVLPSPQKSDSPSRHPKFRNGNLFQSSKPTDRGLRGVPDTLRVLSPKSVPSSPAHSDTKPNVSTGYAYEDIDRDSNAGDHLMQCDVYVKWESKDTTGKLVCLLRLSKSASLADLRREITPYIPMAKEKFEFLMLGDSGAPVEQELEPDLRVGSLPDCPTSKGSRIASLRPPITHTFYNPPSVPFRPIENIVMNSESNANGEKLISSKSRSKLGNANGKTSQTTGNSLTKGLRTLTNGVGIPGTASLQEKASSVFCYEIASKWLD